MFALKNAALMVTMTEGSDLGVAMSTNALELSGSTSEEVSLYFYDRYVGGLGFAEKIYDLIPKVTESGYPNGFRLQVQKRLCSLYWK